MSARARARALLFAWAFALLFSTAVTAQDVLLSAKERTTSINLGDVAYEPGDGFKLGPLRLHPFLRQRAEWNDNLLYSYSNPADGALYHASLGMRADLLPGRHEFSLGYKGKFHKLLWREVPRFDLPSDESVFKERVSGLDRYEHVVEARGVLSFTSARIRADASYEDLSDSLNMLYSGNMSRSVSQASVSAMLLLNRILLEAEADVVYSDFRDYFDYLDSIASTARVEAGLKIGAKFYTTLAWSWTRTHYHELSAWEIAQFDEHYDFDRHSFWAGFKGSLAPKLDVSLRAGASLTGTIEGPEKGRLSPGFFGSALVKWSLSESVNIEANYSRLYGVSQYASWQYVDRGDFKAVYAYSLRVACRLYGFVENTTPARGASFVRVGAGLQAEYRAYGWMSLGAGFERSSRHSSIREAGFALNKAWIHVTVYF